MSGVSAAVRLLEANITDITIIEAADHLGGRIRTVPLCNEKRINLVVVCSFCE